MLPDFRKKVKEHFKDKTKEALYGSGLNYAFGLDHMGSKFGKGEFVDAMKQHCGDERTHTELATDEN